MVASWDISIRHASRVSDAVPPRIARVGPTPLRVHSIFRSAINLAASDGLLTVASPGLGGLPNGIAADLGPDWRMIGVRPGMTVHASLAAVRIPDARLEIHLAAAAGWSPRIGALQVGAAQTARRWRHRGSTTWTIARARSSAGGFGALLLEDAVTGGQAPFVDRARPMLAALLAALDGGDQGSAAAAAEGLIGLGPGLTPSGDDALVGIEAALHALSRPTAGFLAGAAHDLDERTTAVSATLLRHAAAGEFAERIHALLAALLGSDEAAIPAAIDRAVAWGATSGTDCLVGVLLGLDVAAGTERVAG